MLYCLDANVYIEAHRRYYAFDIAPGFWEGLSRLAERQAICSSLLVFEEIADSDDELAQWASVNKDVLFVQPDEATQDAYREIADLVERLYEPQHVQKFLSGADPWVIAQTKAHNLIVVTMEVRKREQDQGQAGKIAGKIQIPNVCERVSVRYIDTFTLLRNERVVLR
jgi:predicted nucleic acid-binding protein